MGQQLAHVHSLHTHSFSHSFIHHPALTPADERRHTKTHEDSLAPSLASLAQTKKVVDDGVMETKKEDEWFNGGGVMVLVSVC